LAAVPSRSLGIAWAGLWQKPPLPLAAYSHTHQGKTDSFQRIMALLDAEEFNTAGGIRRDKVVPFVIRTEKRQAINERGDPLFLPRLTKLITVSWKERHELQKRLYHSVTEYVRWGYDQRYDRTASTSLPDDLDAATGH